MRSFSPEELLGPFNEFEQKHSPKQIFVVGDTLLLKLPSVSIVGSRAVSAEGLKRARSLARKLAQEGIVIVSGLAKGIDAAAHAAAMDVGGRTIAVLGTPLNEFYPKENRELQEQIMREHLCISQFAEGSTVTKKNFPIRNRLMALISGATVIVEAQENSGSLHQAWEALRLDRPLFIMESILEDKALSWPNEVIKYGAQVLSRDILDDLIQTLPQSPRDELAELAF